MLALARLQHINNRRRAIVCKELAAHSMRFRLP